MVGTTMYEAHKTVGDRLLDRHESLIQPIRDGFFDRSLIRAVRDGASASAALPTAYCKHGVAMSEPVDRWIHPRQDDRSLHGMRSKVAVARSAPLIRNVTECSPG